MMTPFQQECISRCTVLFDAKIAFQEVVGKSETYYFYDSTINDHSLTIYIYVDEAEFKIAGKWYIFETPDFDSEDALADAFMASLRTKLGEVK